MPSIIHRIRDRLSGVVGRLTLFSVAMILFGYVMLTIIVLDFLKEEITALSATDQLAIAHYAAEDIGGRVRSRFALLRRITTDLPVALLDSPDQLRFWLQEREQAFSLFSAGLMVIPASGDGVLADFPPMPDRESVDYRTSAWFTAALQGRRPVIGKPMREPTTNEPQLTMAVPIIGAGGKPVAVLAGTTALAVPGFLQRLQQTKIGETGGFLLISPEDGLFVASTNPAMVLTNLPPPGVNKLHDRAMAGFRGTGITVNAFGIEELSAMVSVPSTRWFLVARMPTAEAFQGVVRARTFIIQGSLIIGLLIVAALLVALPRFFQPLSSAAREMRQMAERKIGLHKLPVVRKDEIGELISGFNFLLEKLQENEARMAHMAHHDPLTGLPNRAMFDDRLEQSCSRAERTGQSFAVMFIDLDGFKPVNDAHGHEIGDQALKQVAQRLAKAVRRTDTVARLGGDEFVIILSDLNDPQKAIASMESNLYEAFSKPFVIGELSLTLGLSIGSAVYPEDGTDPETLLSHADQAMYAVKKSGHQRANVT